VDVTIDGSTVRVKGPEGRAERTLHRDMMVRREGDEILVERPSRTSPSTGRCTG
jgi:large subunit ribosomal protein L6